MKTSELTFNGKVVPIDEVELLLSENLELEAIKLVFETCNCDLKEAKNIVDTIESGNLDLENLQKLPTSNSEKVWAERKNGKIIVSYKSETQEKIVVTPNHPLWKRVKTLMRNNAMIEEYENSFNSKALRENTSSKKSFITRTENNSVLYYVFVFLVVAILLAIFFL